jgi:phosphohistidine phosphatase
MHRLHLLRHAKSVRDETSDDRERPLNRRGREASRRIGETLQLSIGKVDLVLSSARRTRETAELVLAGLTPLPSILYEDELYLATAKTLLRRLQGLDEAAASVLAIGHNPGMHKLALALTAKNSPGRAAFASGKFPTGARASFAIDDRWASLGRQRYQLVDYVTPKSASL